MESADFAALRDRISGVVTLPTDAYYDERRRVWNGMIDRRPAALVRVASVADVQEVLAFAQRSSVPLAIRGGGHNVAGNGSVDGGVVLDLGAFNEVLVDGDNLTVTVGGGATLGDVDRVTAPYGLVVPLGVVSRTGVAGLTLGGGVGWLLRSHGLSVDSLLGAEVVTAAGNIVRANAEENADLLWGLTGGGGNFGVVTRFTFRAYPIPPLVYAGNLIYRQPKWRDALAAFDQWGRTVPDIITAIATFLTPPLDWSMGDEPVMILGFASSSPDHASSEVAVAPLRDAVPADIEVIEPVSWAAWQSAVDDTFPPGVRAYWKNTSFNRLDDRVIDVFTRRAAEQTWQGTAFDIHLMGGAYGRVPEDATAFPSRSANYWLNVYGFWDDQADDPDRVEFVRAFAAEMAAYSAGAQYVNFLSGESADNAPVVYGPDKLRRLTEIKRRWDSRNVFHLNHNIPPN